MQVLSTKKFYPVIHCIDPYLRGGTGHALINIRTALVNEADSVFLIGHGLDCQGLSYIYEHVRKQYPDAWIGINFLDVSHCEGLTALVNQCHGLNALWTDKMPARRLVFKGNTQVFGGVAFKYISSNPSEHELLSECWNAIMRVDVATTSGDATGVAPSTAKLKSIKEMLEGRIPLALASGVSEGNVTQFLSDADIFLVASSICDKIPDRNNAEYFISEKIRTLARLIHGKMV